MQGPPSQAICQESVITNYRFLTLSRNVKIKLNLCKKIRDMKYRASNTANNGTTMMHPIEGNNKAQLLKDIREIALGNRFAGKTAKWWVEDENGNTICEHLCEGNGRIIEL